jgi:hypothetical protein
MVKFHSGYPLTEKDHEDVSALCEKHDLELPGNIIDLGIAVDSGGAVVGAKITISLYCAGSLSGGRL